MTHILRTQGYKPLQVLAPMQERGRAVPLSNTVQKGSIKERLEKGSAAKGRGYRKRSTEWEDTERRRSHRREGGTGGVQAL